MDILPARPRWRDVVQTGEFALQTLEKQVLGEFRDRLTALRRQVKLLLQNSDQAASSGKLPGSSGPSCFATLPPGGTPGGNWFGGSP
ncbi:MAG: hypothetical protein ABS75_26445 [Pelagibacterium sp. SCN 63-23]|nr:MAG: hypothetical protein ABS75_26445 [Pelagibacterium sp. SCN 63-23]